MAAREAALAALLEEGSSRVCGLRTEAERAGRQLSRLEEGVYEQTLIADMCQAQLTQEQAQR
jgi:hypothetical protein